MTQTAPVNTVEPKQSGIVSAIGRWFRGLFGGSSGAGQAGVAAAPSRPTLPEATAQFIIAPGGFQIRVPNDSDVPDSVGELLPEVREGLNVIPPLPQVVTDLLHEVQNSKATAASVAAVVSRDSALAASLLRMVNGAASGLSRKVSSISEAVSYLGFGAVKSLVLRLRLGDVLPFGRGAANDPADNEARELWVHSLAVSYIADALAEMAGGVDRGFVSTVALLHDIGKLALLSQFRDRAAQLRSGGQNDAHSASPRQREAQLLGGDHAALGAALGLKWKLPADLVRAIRWHHQPERAFEATDPPALHRAVSLVYVANQLAKYCYAYSRQMEIDAISPQMLESLGLPTSVNELLNARIRAAAAKAIFMAEESASRPPAAIRRLIVLHEGDEAARLLESMPTDGESLRVRTAGETEVILAGISANSQVHRQEVASATETQIGAMIASLLEHQASLDLPALQKASASLVAKALLANLASQPPQPATVLQWMESGALFLAIRSPRLGFAARFGAETPAAVRALESELAGILNLGWIKDARTSNDGQILIVRMPVEFDGRSRVAVAA